jgi:dipeptidyl aminopeptidase/acylaminoacyl peptidase
MDEKSVLVSANDRTGVGMWIQPVDGPARRISLGKVVPAASFWLDASVAANGSIALVGSTATRPAEVYLIKRADAKPERLTEFNAEFETLELGKPETVSWMGADGLAQDGVVTYPPGFDASRKYPLVLYIHGGPRSASKEIFGRAQLFAAQGWVVFEPNYRGSDNLGNAFQSAIWNDAGAGPGRDVMSGVELLKKRGWVDESRMAASGWSYGGYMTTWLLGNYPDVWRAAVAGAAVTDLLDQYNLGDANVRRGSAWGGSPWTDPKRMRAAAEQSPITYATRIKAPTLILSNTGDYRVTVTQSYKLYHALRDRGVATQFIAYPLGGHSPTDPVHSRDVERRWVDWLKRYLGENGSKPSE